MCNPTITDDYFYSVAFIEQTKCIGRCILHKMCGEQLWGNILFQFLC